MTATKSHREIIQSLGGAASLAAELGEGRAAVSNWLKRGIPWRKRYAVQKLAKRKRVPLPEDFLETFEGPPQ